MALPSILILVVVLVVFTLLLFETKKLKHKVLLIFILGLILFGYFSFIMVFKDNPISIKNFSDLDKVINLYLSWLSHVFNNLKIISGQITKIDWGLNSTIKNNLTKG
jgi:hypothetical protein